jgi:hypothetical protein
VRYYPVQRNIGQHIAPGNEVGDDFQTRASAREMNNEQLLGPTRQSIRDTSSRRTTPWNLNPHPDFDILVEFY